MSPLTPARNATWDDELSHAAAELPPGDRYAHLFYEDREDLWAVLASGGVQEVVRTRLRGISARTVGDASRLVFQSDPGPGEARRAVRGAAANRAGVPRRPAQSQGAFEEDPRLDVKPATEALDRLHARAREVAGSYRLDAVARWVAFEQSVRLARCGRPVIGDVRAGCRMRFEVHLEKGSRRSAAVWERVIKAGRVEGVDELAEAVVQRAIERLDARGAPSGRLPVVFAPAVGGILIHELIGHALEADTVQGSGSLLAAQQGVVSRTDIVVIDDPRRGRAAWRLDDEGEEALATPLLQAGRVTGCLHDQQTAVRAGRLPSGHGRRASYQEPVRPRMGCTFLASGDSSAAEVLQRTTRGVYVRRLEAAHTNPGTGETLFRVTDADRIERVQLDAPLSPFLLRVNTLEALATLDHPADDLSFDSCIGSCLRDGQALATSVGAPTFRIGVTTVIP